VTLWSDIAEWRGPVLHHSGSPITDHMYVVIHTADGSYEGTISWQKNPDADNSSHFVVDVDGKIAQVNDTAIESGAQILGNPFSIAIENAGNENTPLTPYQIEANARILAKAHQVHGVPLQLTGRVGTRGLGHHSMGAESGVRWGHSQCPGEIIKAQKPAILARAIAIVAGTKTSTGAVDMLADERLWLQQTADRVNAILKNLDSQTQTGTVGVKATEVNALKAAVAAAGGDPAAIAAALATNAEFVAAIANAVGATVKDQFGPAFDARLTAAARAAVNARLDDNTDT
jgi:N-acetylmuramoyl-L-alanine amidase